ncbi:MAG: hypothetical protein ACPLYX_07575 [Rectinema subterraneum]|uniref:hypothetical protein n=1 Tax=Rectinema subterraneum TaxID=2653714 RepID=UPI003C7D3C09
MEHYTMTTRQIFELIDAEVIQGDFDDAPVAGVYTSDLLSDVLANGRNATVLVTIQAHQNTIAVASIVGISLIIICNSRPIVDNMAEAAVQERIGVVRTSQSQFEVSGRLWQALHAQGEPDDSHIRFS